MQRFWNSEFFEEDLPKVTWEEAAKRTMYDWRHLFTRMSVDCLVDVIQKTQTRVGNGRDTMLFKKILLQGFGKFWIWRRSWHVCGGGGVVDELFTSMKVVQPGREYGPPVMPFGLVDNRPCCSLEWGGMSEHCVPVLVSTGRKRLRPWALLILGSESTFITPV